MKEVYTVKCFSQIQGILGERELFVLAYETGKEVNIHFYLLFKLFMSIFLLYAANKWGKITGYSHSHE